MRISNLKTMKLVGRIEDEEVVVMIDPKPTNNFISTHLVEKLKSDSEEYGKYRVILGKGEEIVGQGMQLETKVAGAENQG